MDFSLPKDETCAWYHNRDQQPLAQWVLGPRGETSTFFLLSRHNVEWTSNDLWLEPWINVMDLFSFTPYSVPSLSPYQPCFEKQQVHWGGVHPVVHVRTLGSDFGPHSLAVFLLSHNQNIFGIHQMSLG